MVCCSICSKAFDVYSSWYGHVIRLHRGTEEFLRAKVWKRFEMRKPEHNPAFLPSRREQLRKQMTGSGNINWKGGISDDGYPPGWNKALKNFIRDFHGNFCAGCGIDEDELDQRLDVHHMDSDKENIDHRNLYPFCKSCHGRLQYWQDKTAVKPTDDTAKVAMS